MMNRMKYIALTSITLILMQASYAAETPTTSLTRSYDHWTKKELETCEKVTRLQMNFEQLTRNDEEIMRCGPCSMTRDQCGALITISSACGSSTATCCIPISDPICKIAVATAAFLLTAITSEGWWYHLDQSEKEQKLRDISEALKAKKMKEE